MEYQKRLQDVQSRIAAACERVGRRPDEVTVIAVTKYVGVEEMQGLLEAGQVDFGENRVQTAGPKLDHFAHVAPARMRWHYIGNLQTNKLKDVLGKFDLIHSLDRLSLAEAIQKRAALAGLTVPCLLQVNVSGEASKSGFALDEVPDALRALREMPGIELRGYMTMAPISVDPEETRAVFQQLREHRDRWLADGLAPQGARELSMGMSGDFEVAVEAGATMVRLGSILVK